MDILCDFNIHEVTNAVDQAKKEVAIRYDLKDLHIQIELLEDKISITAPSDMALETAWGILLQKIINRKLSPQILKKSEPIKMGGNLIKYEVKLVKALDQENAKEISRIIREKFPKVKPSIQGDTIRTSAKSRDELQEVITMLRTEKSIPLPLQFTNYK